MFHEFMSKEYGQCYTFNTPHLKYEDEPELTDAEKRTKFEPHSIYKTGPQVIFL